MKITYLTAMSLASLIGMSTTLALAVDLDRDRSRVRDPDHTAVVDRSQNTAPGDKLQDRDRLVDQDRIVDRDRDQVRDRDYTHDQDRVQDKTQARDRDRIYFEDTGGRIYGAALMTEEERVQFQNSLNNANTETERNQIRSEHQSMIQERAKSQGIDVTQIN